MATYTVTGRNSEVMPIVSVQISGIDQEQQVVDEMTIVNAVRACIDAVPGVESVVAKRYEQVITVV